MKLLSIQMMNFRQFYGETPKIDFAHGSRNRNLTVIHAENGAGKTALLNAFTWLMYDSYTKGFGAPDEKVNRRALDEAEDGATVLAWVELSFEHSGIIYQLRRQAEAIKINANEWSSKPEHPAKLLYADESGEWRSENNVSDAIGRILPKDLHTYFFFDGERIERIVTPTKKEKASLAAATKKLLGIEVLTRSISHLNDARTELEKELKKIGDPATLRLLEEKERKESERDNHEGMLEHLQSSLEGFSESKKEVEKRLRELKSVKHLQNRRDQLNEDYVARKTSRNCSGMRPPKDGRGRSHT